MLSGICGRQQNGCLERRVDRLCRLLEANLMVAGGNRSVPGQSDRLNYCESNVLDDDLLQSQHNQLYTVPSMSTDDIWDHGVTDVSEDDKADPIQETDRNSLTIKSNELGLRPHSSTSEHVQCHHNCSKSRHKTSPIRTGEQPAKTTPPQSVQCEASGSQRSHRVTGHRLVCQSQSNPITSATARASTSPRSRSLRSSLNNLSNQASIIAGGIRVRDDPWTPNIDAMDCVKLNNNTCLSTVSRHKNNRVRFRSSERPPRPMEVDEDLRSSTRKPSKSSATSPTDQSH